MPATRDEARIVGSEPFTRPDRASAEQNDSGNLILPSPLSDETSGSDIHQAGQGDDGDRDAVEVRSVTVSISAQLGARVIHLALNVISTLAIIRYMSPAGYGEFVIIVTVVTLARLISDFGLNPIAVREASVEPAAEAKLIGTVMAMRVGLALIAMVIVQGALLAVGAGPGVRTAGAVASLLLLAEAFITVVIMFQVRIRQQYEALVLIAAETVETGLVLWLIARQASLTAIVAAPAVGMTIGAVVAASLAVRRFDLSLGLDWSRARYLLRESYPVAVAGFIGVLVFKTDSVMLAALRPPEDLGIYGAAYQPVEYLLVGAVLVVGIPLPLLSRYYKTDPAKYRRIAQIGADLILASMLPVAVFLAVASRPLVELFYGAGFTAAADPLRPLAAAMVIMAFTAWHVHALLAAGHQRITVRYNSAALVLAVALNALLIPVFGYMGAALATLATVTVVLALVLGATRRLAGLVVSVERVLRIAAANGLFALALVGATVAGAWLWLSVPLGLVVYAVALQAFGVTDLRSSARVLLGGSGTGRED
jgi:PST family polysaccharide transporter